ncbi:MAG: cytochrome P450, partial [Nocardia sp.]|nr:cytochrome P450 [Nocardia sp.]
NGPLMLVPALRKEAFGHSPWDRFVATRDRLDALLDADIATQRTAETTDGGAGLTPDCGLLGDLLSAQTLGAAADPQARTDLREQLRTMLVAGHETTATTLVWALFRLHRQPRVLRRLRDEIDGAGTDPDELAALPYLTAVCRETLRLHPPLPIVLRRLTGEYRLSGVELAAGDTIGIAVPLLHSDPTIWQDPKCFRPERFLERRYRPFEYMPFGGGHRRCLGAALAEYELRITLATMVGHTELALSRYHRHGPIPRSVPHNIATGPRRGLRFTVEEIRHS